MTNQEKWKTDYPTWAAENGTAGKLARDKAVSKQEPIEIERHEPLAGQRDFLANEPGPDATFKLTSEPKKRRKK